MKATITGQVIGKALEQWTPGSGVDQIMVFVQNGYQSGLVDADGQPADLASLFSVASSTASSTTVTLDGKFADYLTKVGEKLKFSLPSSLGILGERKNGF